MPPRQRSRSARIASLQRLLHTGNISQEGLADPLPKIRDAGEDLPHRNLSQTVKEANQELFNQVAHVETMQLTKGGTWTWEMAEPNKLLTLIESEISVLLNLFAEACRRRAPSGETLWTLAIGYDDFSHGKCSIQTTTERQ